MEVFIIVTVLWVFSVCIHEFGHALAAFYGGDYTVKDKGYFTLNPIHYTHPVTSVLMPVVFMLLGGIGLPGGAVYIERDRLRSKWWGTLVSLAGPAMQLPLMLVIVAVFRFGLVHNDPDSLAAVSLGFLLQLEICSILLNLLPLPPLDGFQAIAPWLPEQVQEQFKAFGNQAMIVLFLVLAFVEPLNNALWYSTFSISRWLGVSPYLYVAGLHNFEFWKH